MFMEENVEKGGESRKTGHKIMSLTGIAIELRKVEEEFDIIYDGNKFVKMTEYVNSLTEQNDKEEKKPSEIAKPTNPSSNTTVENASKKLSSYGITENIVSTSYGHSNKGFLAKTNNNKVYMIIEEAAALK